MQGKKKFDYETNGQNESQNDQKIQDVVVKVLQLILGFIMAIFHM